ncbi:long-chain-fatty-acid--CoA ligase [Brevibacterium album]|uniref:long-chain-fatty-acid--CoA ligase n=1 Tax=Brevibacterium album TaxID=417948 RepID=UPI0004910492|nr:long-chain-fatty-acid--CoA ligase [Brevibacterium album]
MLRGIPSTMGDDHQLNVLSLLRHAAANFPRTEVVHRRSDGGWGRSTYREELTRVARMAGALSGLGVGAGSTVGVLDWNSRRHYEAYFAVPSLGATMVQLNLRLGEADLAYVVNHSQTEYVIVDESLLPIAEKLAGESYVKQWIVASDRPAGEVSTSLPGAVFLEELMAEAAETYPFEEVEESTAAYAGYTTGTTGRPKGVYYSHRASYLHAVGVDAGLCLTYEDVTMPITPMFHVLSWGFPQAATAVGAKMVLPGRFSADDMGAIAKAFVDEDVTVANGAPAIFAGLLQYIRAQPEAPDLSRARLVSGSTEPPVSLMKGFRELTGAEIIHGYGASETSPLVSLNWRIKPELGEIGEDAAWDLKRAQGLPLLGVEVKIVDPVGEELPHDGSSMGELLIRGPWITTSYHKLSDSADRFLDGWWRSGDVAVIDGHGYIKLTDRLKDVIKSGGEWISSIDMENAILDDARVKEAAVIGVPDEKWDERPVAYVVPAEGQSLTAEDVREGLSSRFAKWQLPDEVVFTEELPRTSVGKLDKKAIRGSHSGGGAQ